MKRLITPESTSEITIDYLNGNELVSYRCHNSDGVAVLAKIGKQNYGFIPLNNSNSNPRFVADTWTESIRSASKNRKIFVFENQAKLIEAIHNKKF